MTTHWWTCHNWDKSGSGEAQGGQVWPYGSGKAFPLQGKPSQVRREEAGQASHREMGQTQEGFGRHQRASEILAPRKEAVHVSACITNYCQYVYNTVCVFTCVQPLYMTLTDSDGILLFFVGLGFCCASAEVPCSPLSIALRGQTSAPPAASLAPWKSRGPARPPPAELFLSSARTLTFRDHWHSWKIRQKLGSCLNHAYLTHTHTGCCLRPLQVPIRWLCDWRGPYQCLHFASNSLLPGSGSFPYFLYARFKSNRFSLLLCLCSFCQGDQIIQPWSFMTISVTLVGSLCWATLHS